MGKLIKTTVLSVILILLLIAAGIYIKNNHYVMLYIDPNNDTSVYPYVAKVSKDVNELLFKASELTNDNVLGVKTKVIYTDVYGSGVMKNNITSSDMDYGAGIYLGEFKYNGRNSTQIADMILRTIKNYHFNLLNVVDKSDKFFKKTKGYTILGFRKDNKLIISILAKGIENSAEGKEYEVFLEGKTFKIPPTEILLADYNYIKLFTDEISYYKDYRKILREVTISTSYYADITDEQTGKTRRVEIIEETFNGKRFQTNYRQFVPHAFTDISSLEFARHLVPQDNDKYLDMRLGDYLRHYKDIHFINGIGEVSPLKVVKRILQCTDILAPIIPEDKLDEIHGKIYEVLSDKTVALINDYYVSSMGASDILASKVLRETLYNNGKLDTLINNLDSMLKELEQDEDIKKDELTSLIKYQKVLNDNRNDIVKLAQYTKDTHYELENYLDKLMSTHIKNKEYFIECSKYLENLLRAGGLRIVKLYKDPDNPQIVYIIKDDNTKDLNLSDISKIGLENSYSTYIYDKDTTFKFLELKDFKGKILDIDPHWVRYNTTKTEDEQWENIKNKLIKDKKNYNLKIRAGIIKS